MAGAAQIRIAGPEDAAAIATVHCQAWRETYRGMLPDAMVDGLGPEEAETKWALRLAPESSDEVFLATDRAGTPLGFASGKPSDEPTAPDAGLLDTLYLLRAGQGLGLGRRLLARVADGLTAAGFETMIVVVHADNPAAAFYAAMGAERLLARERLFRGHRCPEILYRWPLPLFASQGV